MSSSTELFRATPWQLRRLEILPTALRSIADVEDDYVDDCDDDDDNVNSCTSSLRSLMCKLDETSATPKFRCRSDFECL